MHPCELMDTKHYNVFSLHCIKWLLVMTLSSSNHYWPAMLRQRGRGTLQLHDTTCLLFWKSRFELRSVVGTSLLWLEQQRSSDSFCCWSQSKSIACGWVSQNLRKVHMVCFNLNQQSSFAGQTLRRTSQDSHPVSANTIPSAANSESRGFTHLQMKQLIQNNYSLCYEYHWFRKPQWNRPISIYLLVFFFQWFLIFHHTFWSHNYHVQSHEIT